MADFSEEMKSSGASRSKKSKQGAVAAPVHLSQEGFSALFDALAAEVRSSDGRLGAQAMPPPSNVSRQSWAPRVHPDNSPILAALRELGASAADCARFVEMLFRHGLGERRASCPEEEPDHALDGRCVLSLLLGYYVAIASEQTRRLGKCMPQLSVIDKQGLWHSVEVLSVPDGEPLPPLQRAIEAVIALGQDRPESIHAELSDKACDAIGGLCYVFHGEVTASLDKAIKLKDDILMLLYFLDGLASSMTSAPPPLPIPEEAVPLTEPPLISLIDAPVEHQGAAFGAPAPPHSPVHPPAPAPAAKPAPFFLFERPSWVPPETKAALPLSAEDQFGRDLLMAFNATAKKQQWSV